MSTEQSTFYLIQSACPECDEAHEYGPFASREDAIGYGEEMADNTDQLLSELKVEARAPITDEELLTMIIEHINRQMAEIAAKAVVHKLIGGNVKDLGDPRGQTISAVLAHTISLFDLFRPNSTLADVARVFGVSEDDNIGDVDGHA